MLVKVFQNNIPRLPNRYILWQANFLRFNFCLWPLTDIPITLPNVRYREKQM